VVYDDELLDDMVGTDITAYVASMRRLLELEIDVVHPGHGASFDRARLHEIVEAYLAFRG
jgi:glyoxylase-like metal-dependent hydrolase (beta-lactamase superfamily II)